jgi:DNA-binding CsgD family transcriptional regulator
MSLTWDLDRVSAGIAAAALDRSAWKPALQRLSDTVGGVGVQLIPVNHRTEQIWTDGVSELADRYIREGWHLREVRARGLPAMLRRGLMVDQDFMTLDEIRKSEYYNDALGPHGLRWFAGIRTDAGPDLCVAAIQRTIAQGPFEPDEQARLAPLRGPLSTAATVCWELNLARASGLADAFDVLGSAALILGRGGQVLRANRTAETTLTSELRIVNRRLAALDQDLSRRIDRLVGQATSSLSGAALGPPVAVPRLGRRPLLVYAVPLVGKALDIFTAARALVIVVDLDARAVPAETHLRQALALTPAEARLAQQLAGGEALDAAADLLQIGKETARSQLKAVFAKTDTSRQAELVALLARLLANQHRDTGAGG